MPDAEPWSGYRHAVVRDLAWLIASPPLLPDVHAAILSGDDQVRWPCAAAWLALHHRHEDWLRRLDAAPEALLATLGSSRDHRLGRYAENLLHFWLSAPDNPEFELVSCREPLRKGRMTLGEPDFLIRERDSGQLWHVELAVKFYLDAGRGEWLGPNRRVSLARKLDRLCRHQLPLLQSPAGLAWLEANGLSAPSPWAWVKGRLFPAAADTERLTSSGQTLQQAWLTRDTLRTLARMRPTLRWHRLAKRYWLAPVASIMLEEPALNIDTATEMLPDDEAHALVALQDGREALRVFVVGDDWASLPFP